jgi:mannose-1-phosphate guanylyltransferase/mannose-6-phosphate isomerase-like protein (cupin superfamily)
VADVATLVSSRADARPPIIFTGEEYAALAQAALAGQPIGLMVLEPVGRSTAFVAAVASLIVSGQSREAILVLLAADSSVSDRAAFNASLDRAVALAKDRSIVLLGVRPTSPSTQFGYIALGAALGGGYRVASFSEKPDAATAARYVADGRHLWNSGNFVFRADTMLAELTRFAPDVLTAADAALKLARKDDRLLRLDARAMERCPTVSLDHAVMEKTANAAVVPLDSAWADVGSWGAIWTLCGKNVAAFIEKVRAFAGGELGGEKVDRPWGSYEVLLRGKGYQVKTIEVQPGQAISLQYHRKRAEHWIVTRGRPCVTVGDDVRSCGRDETVFVDVGAVHRIENPTDDPVTILEIQVGDYLGEDDIVRLEDRYNRVAR